MADSWLNLYQPQYEKKFRLWGKILPRTEKPHVGNNLPYVVKITKRVLSAPGPSDEIHGRAEALCEILQEGFLKSQLTINGRALNQ